MDELRRSPIPAADAEQAAPAAPETGEQPEQARAFSAADVERIVEQRLEAYRREESRRLEAARAEGRDEAERLAQMTAEQRAQHAREQADRAAREREAELDAREAELNRRELRVLAADALAERGLPRELDALLDYSDAEACERSIDQLERVFRAAVQAGVEERLRAGGAPLPAAPAGSPDFARMSDAEYYAATQNR